MDFLVRQISLEYEIILKNAQYIEVPHFELNNGHVVNSRHAE